jgi:hypothetical protein
MKTSPLVSLRLALAAAATSILLAGCGLAEVGASAAAGGASAVEQAKQAKEIEDKVKRDLEAAQQAQADARAKAEEQLSQ